jgi:mRNA interferase RelE/StbE
LTGKFAGLSRYRLGDWRVIYRIDDENGRVAVLSIANRREVYE